MKRKVLLFPKPTTKRDLRHSCSRVVECVWFVSVAGRLFRFLMCHDYEPCVRGELPREFMLRLRPDDRRPLGRRIGHKDNDAAYTRATARYYAQYEFGVWYWPCEEMRVPAYHDHSALSIVPTAALALRKERAA